MDQIQENNNIAAAVSSKKRWLTPLEQVADMCSDGIQFELYSKDQAVKLLESSNSFYRVRSYRSNFDRRYSHEGKGKFLHLDFGMLVDLSVIDVELRNEVLILSLDIEHFFKIRLLNTVEEKLIKTKKDDGYQIVQDFLKSAKNKEEIKKSIGSNISSPYIGGLVRKHANHDWSVWEFIEVIDFGNFLRFYRFCANHMGDQEMNKEYYLLQSVRNIRNACAHNNCVLNDMHKSDRPDEPSYSLKKELSKIGINHKLRKDCLKNKRLQQIATTLYTHQKYVSQNCKIYRTEGLFRFAKRMMRNAHIYEKEDLVNKSFKFILEMISAWYPMKEQKDCLDCVDLVDKIDFSY